MNSSKLLMRRQRDQPDPYLKYDMVARVDGTLMCFNWRIISHNHFGMDYFDIVEMLSNNILTGTAISIRDRGNEREIRAEMYRTVSEALHSHGAHHIEWIKA